MQNRFACISLNIIKLYLHFLCAVFTKYQALSIKRLHTLQANVTFSKLSQF